MNQSECYLLWHVLCHVVEGVWLSKTECEAYVREVTGTGYDFQTEYVILVKPLHTEKTQ